MWSRIKKALKKAWRAVKGTLRMLARIILEALHRILHLPDLLFGFLTWPRKKLRLKVLILKGSDGYPLISETAVGFHIRYVEQVFKERLNVRISVSDPPICEVLQEPPPAAALVVHCNGGQLVDELGEAGEYFRHHSGGLVHPLTAFIVKDVVDKTGCSAGLLTDYVTLDVEGIRNSDSLLAHELGHACDVWGHSSDQSNVMYPHRTRGDRFKWWQKNIIRSSRHVTYW